MTSPPELELPQEVIVAPTTPIYDLVRRSGGARGKSRKLGLFFYSPLPEGNNRVAVAGPCLGAPAAALLAERLIQKGVTKIVLLSACGSLVPDLRIGDLFVPTEGLSEEGTSKLYLEGRIPRPHAPLVDRILNSCKTLDLQPRTGCIWTTDAPHQESPAKIARYRELGAWAVDMEFTALSALSSVHKIQFAALMAVSDEVFGEKPKRGFHERKFKTALKCSAQCLIKR